MSELSPNDKRLFATEFFDGALPPEELAWFREHEMASDPVVRDTLAEAEALRRLVRGARRPEPPAALEYYWGRVKHAAGGTRARSAGGSWLGWMTPLRGLAAVAAALLVAGVLMVPRGAGGTPTVERVDSGHPDLYASIIPAKKASVVWISGLEYLPEGYVLR